MAKTPNDQVEEVKAREVADEELATATGAALLSDKDRILGIIDEMRPIYRAPDQLNLLDELVRRIG